LHHGSLEVFDRKRAFGEIFYRLGNAGLGREAAYPEYRRKKPDSVRKVKNA
jgi:hypothetical protein